MIGAKAAASSQPRFIPCPPIGLIWCAASPISASRPATRRRGIRELTEKALSMEQLSGSGPMPVRRMIRDARPAAVGWLTTPGIRATQRRVPPGSGKDSTIPPASR